MAVYLPKGTRDYLPEEMGRRLRVMDILREIFTRHGFVPLQTPAFERIETLLGKYGDDGQKLIFKILKRGSGGERGECDLALRYDHTVPLARVVAMNPSLRLPLKRWQMAPVWRAERPAKGRFREFTQCDVDVVGSDEMIADAQCIAVAAEGLAALGFSGGIVRLNHRVLLSATAAMVGPEALETPVLVALDKLDKIGRDGVSRELERAGVEPALVGRLWELVEIEGSPDEVLDHVQRGLIATVPDRTEQVEGAVAQLRELLTLCRELGVPDGRIQLDPTLARGLDYYTGPVFEIVDPAAGMGSLAGGGRYDELIGIFGSKRVPAVGVAFGLERLVSVLEERGFFDEVRPGASVLVTVFGADQRSASLRAARVLREAGIGTDLYLGSSKLKAQLKLGHARKARWVIVIGPDEAAEGAVALKDMRDGGQQTLPLADAVRRIAEG